MAQVGDMRVDNRKWSFYNQNGAWEPFDPTISQWLDRRYTSVSGEGANQQLAMRGVDSVASMSQVRNSLSVADSQGAFSAAPASDPNDVTGPTLQYHWNRFMPEVQWPPKDLSGQVDTQLINSFLQSMRVQGVPGFTEATTFTLQDAQGRTRKYGQPPGSNTLIELGIEGQEGTGTPESVDIGGQQYFQQPGADGQFERIPQEKGAGAAPSIEEHGGIQFINQGGELIPIDNMMKKMK